MSTALVVCMGIITVFICLVCLIIIITIMGKIMESVTAKQKAAVPAAPAVPARPAPAAVPAGNKQQLVAAMAAVIAEEMGTDVSRIKIHSIRRL